MGAIHIQTNTERYWEFSWYSLQWMVAVNLGSQAASKNIYMPFRVMVLCWVREPHSCQMAVFECITLYSYLKSVYLVTVSSLAIRKALEKAEYNLLWDCKGKKWMRFYNNGKLIFIIWGYRLYNSISSSLSLLEKLSAMNLGTDWSYM